MKPLEMIAEWRKGCSIAGPACGQDDSPAECHECTEALIDAISSRLSRPFTDWKPIAELPDALKDGRQVLLWDGDANVCRWREGFPVGWDTGAASEIYGDPVMVESPTLYAEIEPGQPDPIAPPIGPMTFHRIGTHASPHVMSARSLRDYLTAVIAVAEATAESPEPSIEMAGGFFVTFTTTREAPRP